MASRDETRGAAGGSNGWRRTLRSIRVRMALLILGLLLINGLAIAFLTVADLRVHNRSTELQLTQTAAALSLAVDGRVRESVGELQMLASSPSLQANDLGGFERMARRLPEVADQWVVLVDDQGRWLMHTGLPPGAPLPPLPSALSQAYRREGAGRPLYVSDLIRSSPTGRPVVGVFVSLAAAGRPTWHLGIAIAPGILQRLFAEQGLPPGWYGSLLDRQGRVVARSRYHARFVGRLASLSVRSHILNHTKGAFEAPALEGYPTLTAYKRSQLTGWTMVVAMPKTTEKAALVRSLAMNVALVLGLMLLGVALVWLLGGRVVAAIRRLTQAAERLGRGERIEPAITGLSEIDAVASAMSEASLALRQREDELREREARIRRLVDANIIGVCFWTLEGGITYANDAFLAIVGYDRKDILSGRLPGWIEMTPGEWSERDRQAIDQIRAEGAARPYEKELVRKAGGRVPVLVGSAAFTGMRDEGLAFVLDLSEQKQSETQLKLMVDELNHRVKNTLATVMAISTQSMRSADTLDEFRRAFQGRLTALSKTHDLLNRSFWTGVDLRALVQQTLAPYAETDDLARRVSIAGEDVRLGPIAAVTLGMALHELAVNAAKYGAFSTPSGRVRVAWRPGEPGRLRLEWEESGGPPVQPPSRRGFGSTLIERVLAGELRGEVRLEFPQPGVRCRMDMALDRVSAH